MADKWWKQCERRGSKWFGFERRTPLSGRNSAHKTASDSIGGEVSTWLFHEAKSCRSIRHPLWFKRLMGPLDPTHGYVFHTADGKELFLFCSTTIDKNIASYMIPLDSKPLLRHYAHYKDLADAEGKALVCTFFLLGMRGFWVLADHATMARIVKLRRQHGEGKEA